MPYRALMWMLVSLGIALLTLTMWVRAVQPLVVEVVADRGGSGGEVAEMKVLVKGTLVLAFVLIATLLAVGLFGAYRERLRRRSDGKRGRTKYVDAWKLAGERLKLKDTEEDS